MAGILGEFFLVSVSHETKHEKSSKNSGKIRSKIRGKIRDENSKNSGNFRSATFLALQSVQTQCWSSSVVPSLHLMSSLMLCQSWQTSFAGWCGGGIGTRTIKNLPWRSLAKHGIPDVATGSQNVRGLSLVTGKYGCTEVRVYPAECGEQLGTDPSKIGSSKSLVLKGFSGEGTLWDSSLPVSLTLWDTPALFTPPLPLPQSPM